jgi:hypothetical protein
MIACSCRLIAGTIVTGEWKPKGTLKVDFLIRITRGKTDDHHICAVL